MAKRKYKAPEGATSITIAGETFDVKRGVVVVSDEASHADMLSHGFVLVGGDDADVALTPEQILAAAAAGTPAA